MHLDHITTRIDKYIYIKNSSKQWGNLDCNSGRINFFEQVHLDNTNPTK